MPDHRPCITSHHTTPSSTDHALLHIPHPPPQTTPSSIYHTLLHRPHPPPQTTPSSPNMICAAAMKGSWHPSTDLARELHAPMGMIPMRVCAVTGTNRAFRRLTPALCWVCRRRPLRSSLKRPSPPTAMSLGRRARDSAPVIVRFTLGWGWVVGGGGGGVVSGGVGGDGCSQ